MNYTLELNHQEKIVYYTHKGVINKNHIGEVWGKLLQMPEFTQKQYNMLSDYREASFLMSPSENNDIIGFMMNIQDIVRGKKQAIIITDHLSTAVSLLFQNSVNRQVGFRVKIFSTAEEGKKWLLED